MKIAFICCLLVLAHIIYMTYLIFNPLPEEVKAAEVIIPIKKTELIYNNEGNYLASVDYQTSNIKIIDISNEKVIKQIKFESGIHSVSFSKIGNNLVVVGNDHKLNLFNSETGQLIKTF